MTNLNLTEISLIVFLAITPLSLMVIEFINKFFLKLEEGFGKINTIVIGLRGIFIDKKLSIESIFIDNKIIRFEKGLRIAEFESVETKNITENPIEKILEIPMMEFLPFITHSCPNLKTKKREKAIYDFFDEFNLNKDSFQQKYRIISTLPSYGNKRISSAIVQNNSSKEIFTFSKGNLRRILEKCTKIQTGGKKSDISKQEKRKIRKKAEKLILKGHKLVAFAIKALPLKVLPEYTEQFSEKEMTFLGYIDLSYPLKYETTQFISETKKLGIKTYIISEMKERIALSSAKELKLINENYFESITGEYLKNINFQKLEKMLINRDKDLIFTEMSKLDREVILSILKKQGDNLLEIEPSEKLNLVEMMEKIKKSQNRSKNKKALIKHAIYGKIAETITIIAALLLDVPLPFTIFSLLFIEFIVNLPIELALQLTNQNYTKQNKINYIILPVAVLFLMFYQLIKQGFELGSTPENSIVLRKNLSTLIFYVIVGLQIVNPLISELGNLFQIRYKALIAFTIPLFILTGLNYTPQALNFLGIETVDPLTLIIAAIPALMLANLDILSGYIKKYE